MTSYHSIEKSFHGIATSVRRWFHSESFHAHTEVNLSKRGYFSAGIDLFDHEEDFSIHLRLIWVWVSFSFHADWRWLAALRKLVRGSNYDGRQLIQCSYFEHSINFHFWWTECDKAKWRGISTHAYMPWHNQWVRTEILSPDLSRVLLTETTALRPSYGPAILLRATAS